MCSSSIHWILTTLEVDIEIDGGVKSKDWTKGIISIEEAVGALD